jgi:uncharacterized protein (TIGR04255 family)
LIQVQHNLFARNWRRNDTDEPYPSFGRTRGLFEANVRQFLEFVRKNDLGDPSPAHCEVTYVNHIFGEGVWNRHSEVDRVFTYWRPSGNGFLPELLDAKLATRYSIPDAAGRFAGRLNVAVQPAMKTTASGQESAPLFVATLTARGKPVGVGLDGAFGFLDIGHEWIVRGFAELTTPDMHRAWERTA